MTQVLPFLLMTFAIFAQSLSVSGLAAGATAATAPTILVYGDSLSAGYGLGAKEGWVTLLDERLRAQKLRYTVVNASISGETSAGGASRIAQALERHRPAIVVVALGSNDGLRGLPVAQLKNNLTAIVTAAQAKRSRVLIVGNRMPPNYGAKYADSFATAFGELGLALKVPVVPFMLEPIAAKRDAFQADNLHPNAAAQPAILDQVWQGLQPLVTR